MRRLILLMLFAVVPTVADPINLVGISGTVDTFQISSVDVQFNWSFLVPGGQAQGVFSTLGHSSCSLLPPGHTCSLGFIATHVDLGVGSALINGVTYNFFMGGKFSVNSPQFTIPDVPPGQVLHFVLPVTFSATLFAFGDDFERFTNDASKALFSLSVNGAGTVSFDASHLGNPPFVTLHNIHYVITPEPATVALIGSGIAGVFIVRRRKGARARR